MAADGHHLHTDVHCRHRNAHQNDIYKSVKFLYETVYTGEGSYDLYIS